MRTILHVDMDAYFSQVEQKKNPSLKGKPIAVVGAKTRTVILSPSYEARKYGVKTGLRVPEARKLCPTLVLVEADNVAYTENAQKIVEICYQFTDEVEVYSIDEMFLDITGSLRLFGSAENIANGMKKKIQDDLALICSVGVAPNKLLAKLASDMKKPNGLVIIKPEDVKTLLENLPVEELWGIGSKTKKHLNEMGIKTCSELGRFPVANLIARFGIIGEKLSQMGRGDDENPVVPLHMEPDPKSVGHSMTFNKDLTDIEEIERYILQLSEKVGNRMRKGNFAARNIGLTIRYFDFETFTRQHRLKNAIFQDLEIYHAAEHILREQKLVKPIRLLGVRASALEKGAMQQLTLFTQVEKKNLVTVAVDKIKERFGKESIMPADLLSRYNHPGVISPSWRPKGIKNIKF